MHVSSAKSNRNLKLQILVLIRCSGSQCSSASVLPSSIRGIFALDCIHFFDQITGRIRMQSEMSIVRKWKSDKEVFTFAKGKRLFCYNTKGWKNGISQKPDQKPICYKEALSEHGMTVKFIFLSKTHPKSHKKACGYNFLPTSCFQKLFCVNEGLQKTRSSRRVLSFFLPKIDRVLM